MKKAEQIKVQVKEYEKLILKQIGAFIHNRRKEKGILIKDLNIMTGVGTAVISDLENQVSMPRIETLLRLCEALEISFPTLFEQMKYIEKNENGKGLTIVDNTNKYDRLSTILASLDYTKEDIVDIVAYSKFLEYRKTIK